MRNRETIGTLYYASAAAAPISHVAKKSKYFNARIHSNQKNR